MNINQFLKTTEERLPTAKEIVALCNSMQIHFAISDGKPVMRPDTKNRMITLLIAKLISREPWRSQVIKIADLNIDPEPPAADEPPKVRCRCGSSDFTDHSIHDGRSTRRDCAQCGRFMNFPIWHGAKP